MTLDLEDLKRKAEAATPGPWQVVETRLPYHLLRPGGDLLGEHVQRRIFTEHTHPQSKDAIGVVNYASGVSRPNEPPHHYVFIRQEDAAHIAAANPATMLALIARIRELEAREAEVRNAALEEAAGAVEEIAERHRAAQFNLHAETNKEAAQLASYAAHCTDDIAAAIRSLKGTPHE